MNPFLNYVEGIRDGVTTARNLRIAPTKRDVTTSDANVMILSPHPDDECIIGALPLRLMREAGKHIINVPITFGSNAERQADRARELADACAYLGWDIARTPDTLDAMDSTGVASLLTQFNPDIIFFPHHEDWNARHISTHELVVEALGTLGPDFSCTVIEHEFWRPMQSPNVMIEVDAALLADLVAATSLHVGEVARNPYHLLLPAWMQDNVRRGTEVVGGQGAASPSFAFATLYRLRRWHNGALEEVLDTGLMLPINADAQKEFATWK